MINITAKDVQTLRRMTDAPMMDCKAALVATKGDMELSKEFLRKKGQQIANKKADRETNQGLIGVHIEKNDTIISSAVLEVLCETDFVARNSEFQKFVLDTVSNVRKTPPDKIDTSEIISRVGENIKIGKANVFFEVFNKAIDSTVIASYIHNQVAENLGSIGVNVVLKSNPELSNDELEKLSKLAHQIAMHIAAMKPKAINVESLDEEFVANEKRILIEQAQDSGKSDTIIEKMVEGRLRKILREACLNDQQFVINPDKTVGQILEENNAKIYHFDRLAIGE